MLIYATADDWSGTPPANVDALLKAASLRVYATTRTAIYAADSEGYPTDTALRDALRDATLAQAVAWNAAGVDPTAPTGKARVAQSKSISGASVTYADAADASAARAALAGAVLVDDAMLILAQAGLTSTQPVVYG